MTEQVESAGPRVIDFKKAPNLIMYEILALPYEEQGKWIDLWLEEPEIKADLERKRQDRKIANMTHPAPLNRNRPDQKWEE